MSGQSVLGPEYAHETRECQGCDRFKDLGEYEIPICRHHLMAVSRTMRVTYPRAQGTCFVPKQPEIPTPEP